MHHWYVDKLISAMGVFAAEGWAHDDGRPVDIALLHDGNILDATVERLDRPDVVALFDKADLRCGFRIRCVLPADRATEGLSLLLGGERVPAAVSAKALGDRRFEHINGRFFDQVRAVGGSVVEIGSRARSGIVRKQQFAGLRYVGFDLLPGENVDVTGDAHMMATALGRDRFDFAYSISVFEHLVWPWKAVLELNAVLKRGGWAYVASHQTWPPHDEPWDFWRFSVSGWHGLFNRTTGFRMVEAMCAVPAVMMPAFATDDPALTPLPSYPGWLGSVCIAEKIGDPQVRWDAAPDYEGIDGRYPA